jgi:hypothetical protein
MCDQSLVPLSVLALDFEPPVVGWGPLFDAEQVVVVEDSIGGRRSLVMTPAG